MRSEKQDRRGLFLLGMHVYYTGVFALDFLSRSEICLLDPDIVMHLTQACVYDIIADIFYEMTIYRTYFMFRWYFEIVGIIILELSYGLFVCNLLSDPITPPPQIGSLPGPELPRGFFRHNPLLFRACLQSVTSIEYAFVLANSHHT
jgi:hypothetical protein